MKVNGYSINTAPTVANPIPNQTALVGTTFSYQFPLNTFNDVDATDTLTYTATKADGNDLPTWLGFTGSTRTFLGTAQAADVATVAVKVTASDGSASVGDEFDIVVNARRRPQTATCRTSMRFGVPPSLWETTEVIMAMSGQTSMGRYRIRSSHMEA